MKGWVIHALWAAATLALISTGGSSQRFPEDRLAVRLLGQLQSTGRISRPVANPKDSVNVTLFISLRRISSVKAGSAEMDILLSMVWSDRRLEWNAADYGGVQSVAVPGDLMWLPDIQGLSTLGYHPDKETASRAVVLSSGRVEYVLPAKVKFTCQNHGNGSVSCLMNLGSWVYYSQQVDLLLDNGNKIDVSQLEPSDQWKVESTLAEKKVTGLGYVDIECKVMLTPTHQKNKSSSSKTKKH